MNNYHTLLLFLFSSLIFCNKNTVYDSYYDFIRDNKEFINSNYYEDNNFYYYLYVYDTKKLQSSRRWNRNRKASIENAFKKARLSAISNLMESICCGFDISKFRDIRKLNVVDNNNNTVSYELDVKQTSEATDIDPFLKDMIGDDIFYGVKIKKDRTLNTSCTCNLKLN